MSDLSLTDVSSYQPTLPSPPYAAQPGAWNSRRDEESPGTTEQWDDFDPDVADSDAPSTSDFDPRAGWVEVEDETRDLTVPTVEPMRLAADATTLPAGLEWARIGQFGTLSEAVYAGAEVAGFERLERYATDTSSGLQAEVYRPVDGGPVVVTVAGTDMWSLRDWVTNALQALSLSPLGVPRQYREALDLVERVRGEFGDNVVVTGHSLGGAIATYSGMRTGTPVVSFNAAGLAVGADATLRWHGALDASRVVQVRVDGELLSSEPVIPLPGLTRLHGTVVTIPPAEPLPEIDSIGEFFGNFLGRQVRRAEDHRIGNVLAAIANEQARTQQADRTAP